VGCAVGSNRHFLDTSTTDRGSATYDETSGKLTLIRNDLQPPASFNIGGSVLLNPAVTLLPDCDVRVTYHVVSQPAPGGSRYSRWYIQLDGGGGNNDVRIGVQNGNTGGSGNHRIVYLRGSTSWMNGPEIALIDGQFRITKTGTTSYMYYHTGSAWVQLDALSGVSTAAWTVKMVAGSWDGEYPTIPPRAGATIEVQLSAFGVYTP
jgi:hypothetical protein